MTVGIRYCGGCNSGYDRAAAAARLERELAPHKVRLSRQGDGIKLDALALLCGCGARCVGCADINAVKVYITSKADVDEAIVKIKGGIYNGQG